MPTRNRTTTLIAAIALTAACLTAAKPAAITQTNQATLTITGPDQAKPNQFIQLAITGLTPDQLASATVTATPAPALLLTSQSWAGQPYLLFSADTQATYAITVSLNQWTEHLATAVDQAADAHVAPALLAQLTAIRAKAHADYPPKHATHRIRVGNAPDPDPPNPPDPPDPTPAGPYQIMLFYQAGTRDNLPAGQRAILSGAALRDTLAERKHVLLEVIDSEAMTQPMRADYKPFVDAVKTLDLPAVAIAPIAGGPITAATLPKTPAEFLKYLDHPK